jgi:hypothetical protein
MSDQCDLAVGPDHFADAKVEPASRADGKAVRSGVTVLEARIELR